MTYVIYATVRTPEVPERPVLDSRRIWLESLDGTQQIDFPTDRRTRRLRLLRGMQGAGVPPIDLTTGVVPGTAGGFVEDVTTAARPMLLPFAVRTRDQAQQWEAVQALRDLTDPTKGMTRDGNFRLVCSSASGVRQLTLAYRSGLEGHDLANPRYDELVLDVVAMDPFARDREERSLEFFLGTGAPFLDGPAGAGGLWGSIGLAPSTVIGEGMAVAMDSTIPFYPTISITGPADSVLITADSGLRIDVPAGVPAGSTLVIVTDPRGKSTRLDGALAAGRVARGSLYRPFVPGTNVIDVTAPGATSATRLALSWRGGYRSLW
ncbi:hypothetical protein CLV28_0716 [Sediminihabitans luteus]|uniref:Uncharacterized protein n=1 Tax=Sediminihabitans luteus TaxID=1138585 RepID=A0A2M9D027_9CELL|nr:hypothetical protein [Sediminihabitans luteus]PJJ77497.1 hypothetical protein CLV28_0716 [Sediminihabitans luteus]GII98394.1 hypothetical protein Slu03_07720 [Sediminihabitans luteus]